MIAYARASWMMPNSQEVQTHKKASRRTCSARLISNSIPCISSNMYCVLFFCYATGRGSAVIRRFTVPTFVAEYSPTEHTLCLQPLTAPDVYTCSNLPVCISLLRIIIRMQSSLVVKTGQRKKDHGSQAGGLRPIPRVEGPSRSISSVTFSVRDRLGPRLFFLKRGQDMVWSSSRGLESSQKLRRGRAVGLMGLELETGIGDCGDGTR